MNSQIILREDCVLIMKTIAILVSITFILPLAANYQS